LPRRRKGARDATASPARSPADAATEATRRTRVARMKGLAFADMRRIQRQVERFAERNGTAPTVALDRRARIILRAAPIETPMALTGSTADQARQILAALAAAQLTQDDASSLLNALKVVEEITSSAEIMDRLRNLELALAAITAGGAATPASETKKCAADLSLTASTTPSGSSGS
jgi:hypothetical protein